jgi:hypothetical protein
VARAGRARLFRGPRALANQLRMLPYARMSASRGLRAAALALLSVGLAVALTYPVAFKLDRVGRLNTDDGRWSIWVVSWVAHALTNDPTSVYDANIFYPHRRTLAYSENNLVAGLLGAPAWVATRNAYATHNTAMLASFVLAFLSATALARHLSGDTGIAIVSGIAYAYCPFVLARTAHIQLMMTFGMPLALLALHRLVAHPTVVRGLWLAAALVAQALACGYYGIFSGLMVGLGVSFYAVSRGLWKNRRYWIAVGCAAAASVAAITPFFLPYVAVHRELGFTRTIGEAVLYSANWQAWLASSSVVHRLLHPLLGYQWSEVLFPGFLTATLGIAGARVAFSRASEENPASGLSRDTAIFYVLVGVLALWSSFGPNAGLYSLFFNVIPAFSFLRAPARFGILVTLALSMLMAMGLTRSLAAHREKRRPLVIAALATAMTLELAAVPLSLPEASPVNEAYRVLARAQWGPVVELPFYYARNDYPRHTEYMLESTHHWMPLINGYSDHIPADFRRLTVALSSFPSRRGFSLLREHRARYAVFHLNRYDPRSRERLLERLEAYKDYFEPLSNRGDVLLFEIVRWP